KEAQIEFETTGTTAGAHRILRRAKGALIDAVLLEATLAGGSPFESLRELRAKNPGVALLVLSDASESVYLSQALDLGADDWMAKGASANVLRARVQEAVRRRGVRDPPPLLRFIDLEIELLPPRARGPAGPIDLAPRELQVLILLVL